jgi:hypothetical protein
MKTLTFNIPDSVDLDNKEVAMLLATNFMKMENFHWLMLLNWLDFQKEPLLNYLVNIMFPYLTFQLTIFLGN